jgi:molybdopterin converting factor small subunit
VAEVHLPLLLANEIGGRREFRVPGNSVRELVEAIEAECPGFRERLCNGERLRPIFRIVIDGKIALEGLDSSVLENSKVEILPAFGGG